MSHTYVSLRSFKGSGSAKIAGDADNDDLLRLLETVSRQVEHWCRRIFHPAIDTRYFSGNGQTCLEFLKWDIISITSLKEDNNEDSVYEVTWASTDYLLGPSDNSPTDHTDPAPYYILAVDGRSTGNQDYFISGQRAYEMVGVFGYCNLTEAVTAVNMASNFSASATELTVDSPTDIGIGDTLVIESEYCYVTGQLVPGGNTFTVSRAANGSTGVAHVDDTAVSKLVYPPEIVEAVKEQAARLWTRRSSGYSNQTGFQETGIVTFTQGGIDVEVKQMLDPYMRRVVR